MKHLLSLQLEMATAASDHYECYKPQLSVYTILSNHQRHKLSQGNIYNQSGRGLQA